MKKLLLMAGLLTALSSFSQSAQQLITAHNFTNLAAINAIANPIRGNLAFNVQNSILYYYNGSSWIPIQDISTSGWSLSGNAVDTSNFLGTTNNQPLKIRIHNSEVLQIRKKGRIINPESIYIGQYNGENETGSYSRNNIGIGSGPLQEVTSGSDNIALGTLSLGSVTTGYHNVALGTNTLNSCFGIQNTAVGARAYLLGSYNKSTAIGANSVITATNQMRFGSNSVNSIGGPVAWSTVSDMRFKENIKENVVGLDFIMGLKPVTYNVNFKALDHHHTQGKMDSIYSDLEKMELDKQYKKLYQQIQIGFLAQEVENLADSLNFDFHGIDKPQNKESTYALRYAEFVAPIVKAMQEQQAIIDSQKKEITKQKRTMKSLIERLEEIEKFIEK